MELNSVDKIKLMMSYDLTKTLHENLSGKTTLNEFVSDIDEAGKASEITKGLESAKDYEQKIIAIANHFNLSTQEVRIAVSKDLTTLDKELETVIRKDANKGLRYGNTLGKNAKEVSKQLALNEIFHSTRPLTEDEIVQIIERNKQASLAKQTEIENSVTKRVGNKTEKDIKKRIPLNEFLHHKSFIEKNLKKFNLIYDFVGSFRRGNKTMGDIDILIMNNNKFNLKNFIKELIELRYIKEILALGKVKFSGIVRLDGGIFRRLDILICPENEYYYSLLYFTGSAEFNIGFRNYVKQNFNISLSEHGIKDNKIRIPLMKSEKDIFDLLGMEYITPDKR